MTEAGPFKYSIWRRHCGECGRTLVVMMSEGIPINVTCPDCLEKAEKP
jgi:hypothetical protein